VEKYRCGTFNVATFNMEFSAFQSSCGFLMSQHSSHNTVDLEFPTWSYQREIFEVGIIKVGIIKVGIFLVEFQRGIIALQHGT
jgi:hypothetical protein